MNMKHSKKASVCIIALLMIITTSAKANFNTSNPCDPPSNCTYLPVVLKMEPLLPLLNGDFELGAYNWKESRTNIIGAHVPHAGKLDAYFTGDNDRIEQITRVGVPLNRPYLGMWLWINAASYAVKTEFFVIEVNGKSVYGFDAHYDSSSTNGWEYRTVDLQAYAGQNINIAFWFSRADTRGSWSTVEMDDIGFTDKPAAEKFTTHKPKPND